MISAGGFLSAARPFGLASGCRRAWRVHRPGPAAATRSRDGFVGVEVAVLQMRVDRADGGGGGAVGLVAALHVAGRAQFEHGAQVGGLPARLAALGGRRGRAKGRNAFTSSHPAAVGVDPLRALRWWCGQWQVRIGMRCVDRPRVQTAAICSSSVRSVPVTVTSLSLLAVDGRLGDQGIQCRPIDRTSCGQLSMPTEPLGKVSIWATPVPGAEIGFPPRSQNVLRLAPRRFPLASPLFEPSWAATDRFQPIIWPRNVGAGGHDVRVAASTNGQCGSRASRGAEVATASTSTRRSRASSFYLAS